MGSAEALLYIYPRMETIHRGRCHKRRRPDVVDAEIQLRPTTRLQGRYQDDGFGAMVVDVGQLRIFFGGGPIIISDPEFKSCPFHDLLHSRGGYRAAATMMRMMTTTTTQSGGLFTWTVVHVAFSLGFVVAHPQCWKRMDRWARKLCVKYSFVPTSWKGTFSISLKQSNDERVRGSFPT